MIQWMSNYDLIVVYESNDHWSRQRSLADPGGPEIHVLGTRVQLWVTLHRVVRHHLEQCHHYQTIRSAGQRSPSMHFVDRYILHFTFYNEPNKQTWHLSNEAGQINWLELTARRSSHVFIVCKPHHSLHLWHQHLIIILLSIILMLLSDAFSKALHVLKSALNMMMKNNFHWQ